MLCIRKYEFVCIILSLWKKINKIINQSHCCWCPGYLHRWDINSHDDGCVIHWGLLLLCVHIIFNTLRPRQNRRHFADDILKCIFLNENAWISLKISLKFVPKVRINNIPALVQIMAWRWPGDKPLSEPMMVSLLTHICITRPQWVKLATPLSKTKYKNAVMNSIDIGIWWKGTLN